MLQKSLGVKKANSLVKIDCLFILRTALAVRFSIPKCNNKYEKIVMTLSLLALTNCMPLAVE